MKKSMKKLMSAFMAVSCIVSATAINSYAMHNPIPYNSRERFNKLIEGGTEFDPCDIFQVENDMGKIKYLAKSKNEFVGVQYYDTNLWLQLSPDTDTDVVTDIVHSYNPDFEVVWKEEFKKEDKDEGLKSLKITDPANNHANTVKSLRNLLKDIEKVTTVYLFEYWGGTATGGNISIYPSEDITDFRLIFDEKTVEDIEEYVAENNLDFTVDVSEINDYGEECSQYTQYRCHLIPNSDITIEEHFAVASKINKDLGVRVREAPSLEGFYSLDDTIIDILNSIDGDANEDGDMNIADATAIIQAIGNPDKYALTEQGYFNADVDSDGLTGLDALAVQIKLANPEK